MTATRIQQSTRPSRDGVDRGAVRGRFRVRTAAFVLLGAAFILVLAAVAATIRISYRPNRGC